VEVARFTPVAPRRAAVLFHDEGGPLVVDGVRDPHQHALSAPAAAAVVRRPATRVVLPQQVAHAVARCSDEPHLLSVDSPTVVVWILRTIARTGDVLGEVPGLKSGSVTGHSVAVPEVSEFDTLFPFLGVTGRRRR